MILNFLRSRLWSVVLFFFLLRVLVGRAEIPGVDRPLRVACVGDSITAFNTYEATLQTLLRATYALSSRHLTNCVVANYGNSGKTAVDLAASYMKTTTYLDSLAFSPDIVLIMLGTNDSRENMATLVADYKRLIQSYLALSNPTPVVYIADPTTMPNEGQWGDNDQDLVSGVIPRIHIVSQDLDVPVVDLHTPTGGHPEWVGDGVHPGADPAGKLMAAAFYKAMTGLQPPASLFPPVWFSPTTNLLANGNIEAGTTGWTGNGGTLTSVANPARSGAQALRVDRTTNTQGPLQDVTAQLLATGQGDYFFEAWARLATITNGSPTVTLTLTLNDSSGKSTFVSDSPRINTTSWANPRIVKAVSWSGTLSSATLSLATSAGNAEPLIADDVLLQKYPYATSFGLPNAPSFLTAAPTNTSDLVVAWTDNSNDWPPQSNTLNETSFQLDWATDRAFSRDANSLSVPADTTRTIVSNLNSGTTYYFRIKSLNANGEASCLNPAVATTAGAAAEPTAPTTLTATATNGILGNVRLTWNDLATTETGYRVEWAIDASFGLNPDFIELPANSSTYTVTGINPSQTYAFRVRALGSPSDSAASPVVEKITWRATPDGTATNLSGTLGSSTTVNLKWVDDCVNETKFGMQYATDSNFTQNAGVATVAANATSGTLSNLLAGRSYYIRVVPINAVGSGTVSLIPGASTGAYTAPIIMLLPPNPPSVLTTWTHSASQINLTWTDNAANESGFLLDRALNSGFTSGLITSNLAANATGFIATGLAPDTTYYFRLRSYNDGGESDNSDVASATTPHAGTPFTPSGMWATTATSSQINLGWNDNSSDETGFKVDVGTNSAFAPVLATVSAPANATNCSATGLADITPYYFRVYATNAAGASVSSETATATTLPLPPVTPGPLVLSSVTEAQVALTWTDNSDNELGFHIDAATDSGFSANLVTASVSAGNITYTFTSLNPHTTYYFRVRGFNTGGESVNSNPVQAETPGPTIPAVPSGLTGTAVSESQINLFWIDSSFNETHFVLERATNPGFTTDLVATNMAYNTTEFSVIGLATFTTYYFRIRAVDAAGESDNSNTAMVKTLSNVLDASEPFAYTPGTTLNNATGGAGWSAKWIADAATYSNAPGSLAYSDGHGKTLITSGNRVVVGPLNGSYKGANRASGIFTNKMSGGQPLDIWFSCLFKPDNGSCDFNPCSTDPYYAGVVARGANVLAHDKNVWTGGGTETGASAPSVTLVDGSVNLIVCRYQVAADKHSFTYTWHINPTNLSDVVNSSTRKVWTATNTVGTLTGLTGFGIRNVDANASFELDEFRYGDSAALVTPYAATPLTPTGFIATAVSSSAIDLTWVDVSDNETGFTIERATDAGFTTNFVSTVVAADSTSNRVSGLAANTLFFFRIRANNAAGNSPDSAAVSATTPMVPAAPPAAPADLAVRNTDETQISLGWTDLSDNEDGFRLDSALNSGFSSNLVTTLLPANTTNCNATGLTPSTLYYFRVRSYNSGGDSSNSTPVNASTLALTAPLAPDGLAAVAISASAITLSWADHASNEAGFELDQALDNGFTSNLVTSVSAANTTNTSATGLAANTTYYFRVRALNSAGASSNSAVANASTFEAPPAAPGPITMGSITETQISLSWIDNSANESGFRVDRAMNAGFTSNLTTATLSASVTNHTATGLLPGKTYHFRVRAYNAGGETTNASPASATTLTPPIPPAPSGLSGVAVSESQINLTWTDNSLNETGFSLDRAMNAAFSSNLVTTLITSNATNCIVTGLAANTAYYFKLRATAIAGESDNSNTSTVTTLANLLLTKDPVDGTAGTVLNGKTSGSGWTGAWVADTAYTNTSGSLAYTDALGRSLLVSANRMVFGPIAGGYKEAHRSSPVFTNKMSGGQALDIWFSCLLKPGNGSRDFNPWSMDPYNAGTVAQGATTLTYFNSAWTSGTETNKTAPNVTLIGNQVNFIVCRYEVPADKHAFTWTWYINPTNLADVVNSATKKVWTATNTTGTLKGLTGFGVRARVDANTAFELDEIRYGDSASLVAPYAGTGGGLGSTVGDGIPDVWRSQYFAGDGTTTDAVSCATADPDKDGMNNELEYITGSNPTNEHSRFEVRIVFSNGLVVAEFDAPATSGNAYTGLQRSFDLERNTNMISGSWDVVPGFSNVLGQGQTVSSPDNGSEPRRFFRAKARLQ